MSLMTESMIYYPFREPETSVFGRDKIVPLEEG
jgi:hypothetical protein